VKANFWDVGGDEGYFDIRNEFYKDTNGTFLVYDVTERTSFDNINIWVQEFNEFAQQETKMILVAK
jgi:GTPase SAR1 family protein